MSRHRGLIVLLLDAVVFATCNFLLFLPYLCSGNIKLLNLVLHMGLLSACVFVFQLLLLRGEVRRPGTITEPVLENR